MRLLLQGKQALFYLRTAGKTADAAACHHSMAGDEEGNGIGAAGLADGAGHFFIAEHRGNFSVGGGRAETDGAECLPDLALEWCCLDNERAFVVFGKGMIVAQQGEQGVGCERCRWNDGNGACWLQLLQRLLMPGIIKGEVDRRGVAAQHIQVDTGPGNGLAGDDGFCFYHIGIICKWRQDRGRDDWGRG